MSTKDRTKCPLSEKEIQRREDQRCQELLSRDDIERDYKGITAGPSGLNKRKKERILSRYLAGTAGATVQEQ